MWSGLGLKLTVPPVLIHVSLLRRTPLTFTTRTVRQVFRLEGVSDEETEEQDAETTATNHHPSPVPPQTQPQSPLAEQPPSE